MFLFVIFVMVKNAANSLPRTRDLSLNFHGRHFVSTIYRFMDNFNKTYSYTDFHFNMIWSFLAFYIYVQLTLKFAELILLRVVRICEDLNRIIQTKKFSNTNWFFSTKVQEPKSNYKQQSFSNKTSAKHVCFHIGDILKFCRIRLNNNWANMNYSHVQTKPIAAWFFGALP